MDNVLLNSRWRPNCRAILGLIALAVQLFAGFAHHHDHSAHAGEARAAGLSSAIGSLLLAHAPDCEHEHDGSPTPDNGDEHDCGICLALTTLRAGHLPDAFRVPAPSNEGASLSPAFGGITAKSTSTRAHGARAPPRRVIA
jgi:hypothetical protein